MVRDLSWWGQGAPERSGSFPDVARTFPDFARDQEPDQIRELSGRRPKGFDLLDLARVPGQLQKLPDRVRVIREAVPL